MSVGGLMPDSNQELEPIECGKKIIDRYVAGEITLEEFVAAVSEIEMKEAA